MELKVFSKIHGEQIIMFDDEDYVKLKGYNWYIAKNGKELYAWGIRNSKVTQMHRLLTNCPKNLVVDHINHNCLDNRKCNLRICSLEENNRNKEKTKIPTTSKYKGVFIEKERANYKNKVKSQISMNGRTLFLGRYPSELDAALVYNGAAKCLYGEFANLNIIGDC